jgi:ribosomal protein S18 acetylase RimI-like enzyme
VAHDVANIRGAYDKSCSAGYRIPDDVVRRDGPAARNAKIGRRLVEAVCNHARQQVEQIQLSVAVDNEQARSLYARLGFLEYGLEKNALKQAGRYYDLVLMAKDVSRH